MNLNKMMSLSHLSLLILSLSLFTGVLTPNTASAYVSVGIGWGGGGYWHGRPEGWYRGGPYYYPRPYYYPVVPQSVIIQPAPQPPVTYIQPQMYGVPQTVPMAPAPQVAQVPAPVQTSYYCKSTGTYYPDTMTCPLGWTPVTPGAPPAQ